MLCFCCTAAYSLPHSSEKAFSIRSQFCAYSTAHLFCLNTQVNLSCFLILKIKLFSSNLCPIGSEFFHLLYILYPLMTHRLIRHLTSPLSARGKARHVRSHKFNSLEQTKKTHQTVFHREATERHFQVKKQSKLRKASLNDDGAKFLSVPCNFWTITINLRRIPYYLSHAHWTRFIVWLSRAIPRKLIWVTL